MTKRLFFCVLAVCGVLLVPSAAFAADIVWRVTIKNQIYAHTEGNSLCSTAAGAMSGTSGDMTYEYTFRSGAPFNNNYNCTGDVKTTNNLNGVVSTQTNTNYASLVRYGCPADKPYYNFTTHVCEATAPPPPPPVCKAGEQADYTYDEGAESAGVENARSSVTNPVSDGKGCQVQPTVLRGCYSSGGRYYCKYGTTATGGTAAAGAGAPSTSTQGPTDPRIDVPPFKPPSGKCPLGTVQGGVSSDGVPICIGTGTDPKNAPPPPPKVETEKNETLADGSTQNTKTTTTTNADGSKTTNTTVTITKPDGTKSSSGSSTTGTTPAGASGKADTPEKDQYDLCEQNPMLTICRNSSVSGTCGEITCVGDAIQCATLRAAAAMQCQQKKDLDDLAARPEVAAGNAILAGNDPQKAAIDAALKGTEVDMSKPALDDSGFVSSRSCLAPRTLSVAGKSIAISFDELCDNIEALRYAVLACAWIVAYLVVSRSILNS